jgi:hypothetical protein
VLQVATLALAAAIALAPAPSIARAAEAPIPTAVTLKAAPRHVTGSQSVTLSGHLTGAAAGASVTLSASPYPYTATTVLPTTVAAVDGAFQFTVHPDRDTRYGVELAGTPSVRASTQVDVTPVAHTKVRALPLGRAKVVVVVFHPRDLSWSGATVDWTFTSGGGTTLLTTRTARISPYALVFWATVALPAGRFNFQACFHAKDDHALENPGRPAGCTGRGSYGGGSLPQGFPGPAAIARAAGYLQSRTGRKAFAVIDTEGRLAGANVHWTFPTASVVKAMLLTAYLRRLHAQGQHTVDGFSNSFLYPMIHVSDNSAATQTWSIVGDSGLYEVARAAGMTDFSVSGLWGSALLSPADQAHFFFIMDSLIPREFVGYARFLLSTIVGWQSWGIAAIARPLGYQAFFKDGSEPTGLGQLVHQVDRLEGHGRTLAIAVMTDGDPTMQYGIDTIQGVASALLR